MWRAGTVRNSSDGYCSEKIMKFKVVTQNGDTILADKMILATGILREYF
jgi:thioredoxin reductase